MIGKTIAVTVATLAMMSQASVAVAANGAAGRSAAGQVATSGAPHRSVAASPVGVASNRAALGLPIAATPVPCTLTDGVRVACATSSESSALAGTSGSIFILLGAIAAIGLGVAAAASQSSAANSP